MMKIKKNIIFITLSTVAIVALSGCGGGSDSSSSSLDTQTTPVSTSNTEVQVIDGYVVGATVTALNNPNCKSVTEKDGKATLLCKAEGFKSIGGKIDFNSNGIADPDEHDAPNMIAPAGYSMATPLTTLIATGKVTVKQIADVLGITTNEVLTDPYATGNINLAKAYNLAAVSLFLNAADKMAVKISEAANSMALDQPSTTDLPQLDPPSIEEHLLPTLSINLELFTVIVKSLLSEVADTKDITSYSLYVDSISTSDATTPAELDNEISNYLKNLETEISIIHQDDSVIDSNSNNSNTHVDLLPSL